MVTPTNSYARSFRSFLCALTVLAAADAPADPIEYRIELDVPRRFEKLMHEQLDIYRQRGSDRMDEAQLLKVFEETPDRIREVMATEGYFSPVIDTDLLDRDDGKLVRIAIDPGRPTLVEQLNLRFSGGVSEPAPYNAGRIDTMRNAWRLRPGQQFTQMAWERSKRDVLRHLLSNRYPAARIASSQATIDPATHKADLDVEVDSGPAFVFGELEIEGLQRYPASIIENLNPSSPGDPYDQEMLYELQRRLRHTGYFADVFVSAPVRSAGAAIAPLIVTVVERPTKKLSFGVGFSTNTGARLQAEYRDNNVRARGWRWRNELKLESKQQLLATELAFPTARSGWYHTTHASLSRSDIEGELARKIQLGVKRAKTQGKIDRALAVLYARENRELAGAPGDRSQALSANYLWTRRDVDDPLYPHRGYFLHLELGGAAQALLSDRTFVRGYAKTAYFHPVSTRDTWILGGELGLIAAESRHGIPSQFLFRAGGDQSVRGYSYQSIGVREGDAIVGGRYLATASVEYERYFNDAWGAAVFYDVGTAGDALGDLKFSQGAGVGLRWRSPVGPLKLDLAYGQRSEKFRLHFAVGFVF